MGLQLGFKSHKAKALPAIVGPFLLFGLLLIIACASKSPTDPTAPGSTNTATNAANTNATNSVPWVGYPVELQGTWTNRYDQGGGLFVTYSNTFSKSNFTHASFFVSNYTVIYGTNGYVTGTYVTNSGSNWVSILTYLNAGSGPYTFDGTGTYTTGVGSNYASFRYVMIGGSGMAWSAVGSWGTLSSRLTNVSTINQTNVKQ